MSAICVPFGELKWDLGSVIYVHFGETLIIYQENGTYGRTVDRRIINWIMS